MAQNNNRFDNEEKSDRDVASSASSDSRDTTRSVYELQSDAYSSAADKVGKSSYRQLRCKMSTMTYSTTWIRSIFFVLAIFCIPIGVLTFMLSQSVVIQEFPAYDSLSNCSLKDNDPGTECVVRYELDYDFEAPIYFHYKLTKFYQNHRSYVKSLSRWQFENDDVTDYEYCDPSETQRSVAEDDAYNGLIMLPCGLIANSFFNDKFKVRYIEDGMTMDFCDSSECDRNERGGKWSDAAWFASPNWERSDIAWSSDNRRFESTQQIDGTTTNVNEVQFDQNVTLPATDDPDFIVWMRTSTVPTFSKLYRIIRSQSLKKGATLEVTIRNYFEVDDFEGTKSLLITTNSSLGGRNDALGIGFMVVGSVSFLTAVFFWVMLSPQKLYPLRDL